MIRRLLFYSAFAVILFITSYGVHSYGAENLEITYPFELKLVYLFHALTSLGVVITLEMLYSTSKSFRDQLGFIYLGSTAMKVLLFFIIFSNILYLNTSISKIEKIALLIPLAIFMIFEVIIVVYILNRSVKS